MMLHSITGNSDGLATATGQSIEHSKSNMMPKQKLSYVPFTFLSHLVMQIEKALPKLAAIRIIPAKSLMYGSSVTQFSNFVSFSKSGYNKSTKNYPFTVNKTPRKPKITPMACCLLISTLKMKQSRMKTKRTDELLSVKTMEKGKKKGAPVSANWWMHVMKFLRSMILKLVGDLREKLIPKQSMMKQCEMRVTMALMRFVSTGFILVQLGYTKLRGHMICEMIMMIRPKFQRPTLSTMVQRYL